MSSLNPSNLVYEAKQSTLVSPRGKRSALLIVDVQNDFLSGGSVPHVDTDRLVSTVNTLRNSFRFELVVVSQDWHPSNHISFVTTHLATRDVAPFTTIDVSSSAGPVSQRLWPVHCVQSTAGAELAPDLQVYASDIIIKKGSSAAEDSASLFMDDASVQTPLAQLLSSYHISDVYIVGIGLEHALGRTALDAAGANAPAAASLAAAASSSATSGAAATASSDAASASAMGSLGVSVFVVIDAAAALKADPTATTDMYSKLERAGVTLVRSTVMAEQREDRRRDTAKYLAKHNVMTVFEKLCASLVYHKPADPVATIVAELQKLQAGEGMLSSLSLFSDDDIEVYFNMMDPTRKGVLDAQQAKRALHGLGVAHDSLQIGPDDSFAAAEFKVLVKRATERRAMME